MKSIIILVLLVILLCNIINNRDNFINEPCSDKLTDKEYLLHMIPHHQVAVDISIMLQKITKDPIMQDLLRKLIWTQKYEIGLMKELLDKLPYNYKGNIEIATASDELNDENATYFVI